MTLELFSPQRYCRIWLFRGSSVDSFFLEGIRFVRAQTVVATTQRIMFSDTMFPYPEKYFTRDTS